MTTILNHSGFSEQKPNIVIKYHISFELGI